MNDIYQEFEDSYEDYRNWKAQCNSICAKKFMGLETDDFADWHWWDAFDSGLSPEEAIETWIEDPDYGPGVPL